MIMLEGVPKFYAVEVSGSTIHCYSMYLIEAFLVNTLYTQHFQCSRQSNSSTVPDKNMITKNVQPFIP